MHKFILSTEVAIPEDESVEDNLEETDENQDPEGNYFSFWHFQNKFCNGKEIIFIKYVINCYVLINILKAKQAKRLIISSVNLLSY